MSSVAERVVRTFVSPAPAARPVARERVLPVAVMAVVGSQRLAPAVATSLALALAGRSRARSAVVARWPAEVAADAGYPAPRRAARSAHALASQLRAHGLEAVARGRVVDVLLAADHPGTTLVAAQAAAGVPCVLALVAPRDADTDAALAGHDAIVLAGVGDGPLRRLTVHSLSQLGPPVVPCAPPDSAFTRGLARTGTVEPPGWRRALAPVLELAP